MAQRFEPKLSILPAAQREVWPRRLYRRRGRASDAEPAQVTGRINDPLQTADGTMLVASLEDLLATKLKATLDRAEAKDYRDIAEMISAGVSLPRGLAAFKEMFRGEPAQVLRAIGFFEDGDLRSLSAVDRQILRQARDQVGDLPHVSMKADLL